MDSDDDLLIEGSLEADGGLILTASSGSGSALCLDGSNNVVTCTAGTGGISGSGTAGQVAFFDTSSSISSEASGFGWDSTNNLFTITGGTGNTTQTAQTITSTAQGLTSGGLLNANLTNTSATASFTGDILGVNSTRDNDLSQTLTDSGNLVEFGRVTTTNAAGATTNVTGAVLNITNTVTATSGTINDSANLISVTQDADATGALLYLNTNRSSTGTAMLIEQSAGGTDILQVQDNGNLTIGGDLAITGGNITTAFTADSTVTVTGTLTADGTFDANGIVTLGDGGDSVELSGSSIVFDIAGTDEVTLSSTGFSPSTAGGNTLGSATNEWAGLYLGDSSPIYFGADQDVNFQWTDADLDLDIQAGSAATIEIISNIASAARTADLVSIIQENSASFNASNSLLQLTNNDTGSTMSVQDINQESQTGTGLSVFMGAVGSSTGDGVLISSTTTGVQAGQTSSLDLLAINRQNTNGGPGSVFTEAGNLADLSRTLTNNNASGSIAVTGDVLSIVSSMTETNGTITDTANMISVAQNCGTNVDCTGSVVELTNGGTGNTVDFLMSNASGTQTNGLLINRTGAGTTTNAINITETSGTITNGLNFGDNNLTLDINAVTDLTIGIGGSSEVILTGTNLSASTAEGNSLGSATLEWEQLFVGDDNGISFGLDQDWTLTYDEATDDRLELITSGTTGMLVQSATATGTAFNLIDNSISTGTILQTESTATTLTTAGDAFLGYFNWNPGGSTTASGDLFRINIGANGNVTNLFNITNNGSSLFSVSESSVTSTLPLRVSDSGVDPVNQALAIFDQDENQDIITASASGVPKFVLDNSGRVYLGALDTETANTTATCWFDNTINGVTLKEITDCNGTPTDLAENFGTTDVSIEAGDVVVTDGQAEVVSPKGLLTSKAYVKKSDSTYNSKILGVVSTAPNQVYGEDGLFSEWENPRPISLAGRVPTKVNLENGPILTGDSITSSSTPGVAMKATQAGTIIGKALQDFNPTNPNEVGKIIVIMNVGYENPAPENGLSRDEIEELLLITEQNQALIEASSNWNTNTATASGEFDDLITNNLFVTGIAAFDSLSVTNIDSLTEPLNIGSGLQPINLMAGKVAIDTSGNVVIEGDLKVLGTLDANKVSVSQAVAGSANIVAGTNELVIQNENIKLESLIFVTPTSPTPGNIYVKSQSEGQATIGFDPIVVNEVPVLTTSDIKFNWWIVGVSQ